MRVFVTGASGFIGSHLLDYLLARGDTVCALRRNHGHLAGPPTEAAASERLRWAEGDVLDRPLLSRLVSENAPQEIYHLAAQSFPHVSWKQPWLTHQVNVEGTLNILEAARAAANQPAVVVVSSSSIYSQRADGAPIREDDPCQPASPYGVSKLAADHLARLYAARYGMRVLCARPFFLIGPGKTGDVASDWARNVVAVERGAARELAVGNLDIVRDFLHVADGVEGLALIADKGTPGEAYNVSSGEGLSLAELLKTITSLGRVEIEVRVDPAKFRQLDERVKVGDSAKLQSLGWRARRSVAEALHDILEYWRQHWTPGGF
jgi:GDP-4-dehydro-6-deoxy-D-mannose reductase